MRKTRFTEEQIAQALRQAEAGTPVREVIRKVGVSEQTFYRWKRKFEGMGVAELRRLRQLEEENRKLKGLVADLSLDKRILQDVIEKNVWSARTVQRDSRDGLPPAPMYPASLWSDSDCSGPCAHPSSKTASV
jgi:putative transposase